MSVCPPVRLSVYPFVAILHKRKTPKGFNLTHISPHTVYVW